jgi:hypothetical protein
MENMTVSKKEPLREQTQKKKKRIGKPPAGEVV